MGNISHFLNSIACLFYRQIWLFIWRGEHMPSDEPITVDNPPDNALPNSITPDQVLASVRKSGYPLQTRVAELLAGRFQLQEEWSYIDSDTGELRSLDIIAHRSLYDFDAANKRRVRPILSLLIECKQSDLPYVFFLNPGRIGGWELPYFAGLFGTAVTINTDDDRSTWQEPIIPLLGLRDEPFVKSPPESSVTFTKCARKGKDFELSGSDPFLKLVMPLVKATKHFVETNRPPKTAHYHDLHIAVPIGVIDAPMVGVSFKNGEPETKMIPWVRTFRHESVKAHDWTERSKVYAMDLVHRAYLSAYIDAHLVPFAEIVAERSLKHDVVLADLEGFIPGMGEDSWTDLEVRLQPRGIVGKVKDAALRATTEVVAKALKIDT